jgi:hypothetical protein
MRSLVRFSFRRQEGGQSLVEVALFLPILLIMLVGIVEVGNLLVTQNRVTTAARTGAGFGSTYYVENDWEGEGGTAEQMGIAVINTVTETLDINSAVWDVWSIYAKVDENGTGFETFDAVHVEGDNLVVTPQEWDVISPTIQSEMWEQLLANGSSVADLEVVGSLAYHDLQPMLGVNVWQWTGYQTVRDLTVMRVDKPAPYVGCAIMPIAVFWDQVSRYPYNYTGPAVSGTVDPQDALFPEPGDFDTPDPGPDYSVPNPGVFANVSNFHANLPGVPLINARRGYLYLARETGHGSGSFGWLSWENTNSQTDLEASLDYPGNFWETYPGSVVDTNQVNIVWEGQTQDSGNSDGALDVGEWVAIKTGNVNSNAVRDNLEDLFGRTVRLVVFDTYAGSGTNVFYRVYGFILVRIPGWDFGGVPKNMAIEFIRWDNSCDITLTP